MKIFVKYIIQKYYLQITVNIFSAFIVQQKQTENEKALRLLAQRLDELDHMTWEDRQLSLVQGILAGNVFDWGAKEVASLMETQDFGFSEAMEKLQSKIYYYKNKIFPHFVIIDPCVSRGRPY